MRVLRGTEPGERVAMPDAPDALADDGAAGRAGHTRQTWIRVVLSVAVAAMGVIDLLSAMLSHPSDRLLAIRHLIPTDVLDTSRTFTLLAGALLLVTAWGLRRGKRRAYVAALFLCAASVPVNVLKSLDFEEATSAAALMFVLGLNAEAFRVKSRSLTLGALRWRALLAALGLAVYAVVACGWVALRYAEPASPGAVFREAAYQLVGVGSRALLLRPDLAPSAVRIAHWLLDSVSVLAFTLLVGFALLALRPVAHRRRHGGEVRNVAALLRAHGASSVAAHALEHSNDYFFSPNGRAVIAYRFESDTLLCVGDPIGPPEEMPALLEAFAADCREHDWEFAFFQARPEWLPTYRRFGWRALHIGEDPILWTERFTLEGSAMGDVRRSVHRLDAAGMEARIFVPGVTPFSPERESELYAGMKEISSQWVHAHHGAERGFCMGRLESQDFAINRVTVAWNPTANRVEGFLTWTPIWSRNGWALDLMRRRSDATPGTMEFLVVKSLEDARQHDDALLSLSLSALASEESDAAANGNADAVEAGARPDPAREFLMQHLARFYDFKGLFRWKKKFAPEFEDRYLVYPGPLALPRVALALVRAQSGVGIKSYFRRSA